MAQLEKKIFFVNPLTPSISKRDVNFVKKFDAREVEWERKWNQIFGVKKKAKIFAEVAQEIKPIVEKKTKSGKSRKQSKNAKEFQIPFNLDGQPNQVKKETTVFKNEVKKLKPKVKAETSSLQSKNEALQKRVETLEKQIAEFERMKIEKETKSPEETIDLSWTNSSKNRDRQYIAEQLGPQNAKKVIETELGKSEAVKKATDTLERVGREREEKIRQEINQRKIEPIAQSTTKAEVKPKAPEVKTGIASWDGQFVKVTGYAGNLDGKDYVHIEGTNAIIPLDEIEYPKKPVEQASTKTTTSPEE
ncbi:MAG: hypothetical protein U1E54_01315, partial [Candidatus Levybacteria bacterium]|nr:hypothetical protein [Candidatus Levybacteria bacterium]